MINVNYSGAPRGYLMDDGEEETAEPPPEEEEEEQQPEASPDDDAGFFPDVRASTTTTGSDCPIENGAVYTQWGAVQAGTVIAGIASGYEKQEISTTITGYKVNSRYAVTIAGKRIGRFITFIVLFPVCISEFLTISSGILINWLKSSGETCSGLIPITLGVFHGSHLGPLLFNIYLNDVATCFKIFIIYFTLTI